MTAYPTWTPASRPGIVPLQPLTFGTILGRSFSALRHNPRVLLGFALSVQALGLLLATGALVAAGVITFSRLASLRPGSEDFEAVMAGSVALLAVVGFIVTIAVTALGVIVQAVVVAEVAHAVVAERLTLGRLWQRIRPVAWRLIGYGLLVMVAVLGVLAAFIAVFVGTAAVAGPASLILLVLAVLASIPLGLWLSTKLLLVPAVLVLEHATVRGAIARSWRLTRGRFWPALGVTVIINTAFSTLAQVVAVPLQFAAMGVTTVLTPTGDPDVEAIIGLLIATGLGQVLILVLQCVSIIVLSTSSALIYIDCRMRHEALDQDLLAYVDRRDAGATDLPDPYAQHIGRTAPPRWTPPAGWGPPVAAPTPVGPPTAWPPPSGPRADWPPPAPTAGWPAPAAQPTAPVTPPTPSTQWTAPGAGPT